MISSSSSSYICHEVGHLLTRSGLTCLEISSKVCLGSFCQPGSSVSLPWVIYYEAFCINVLFSFSCILVICTNDSKFIYNLLKLRDYFTYHQVGNAKILHGSHNAFMWWVWISQQRATFVLHGISRLVLYNRGGECLLRCTHWVLI
jgi:hypothetical protein